MYGIFRGEKEIAQTMEESIGWEIVHALDFEYPEFEHTLWDEGKCLSTEQA